MSPNSFFNSSCYHVSVCLMLLNIQWMCVVLTVIIMRRASIMPSIMYRLLVSPPAHKGPKMVARPPTERLTPWLKPLGDASQRIRGYFFHLQTFIYRLRVHYE